MYKVYRVRVIIDKQGNTGTFVQVSFKVRFTNGAVKEDTLAKFDPNNQSQHIDREQALEYLRFVRQSLHEDPDASQDVIEKADELMRAVDNAEQFVMILRVTDMGMINNVRRIRHELQVMVRKPPAVH